jgi:hypothetical protein
VTKQGEGLGIKGPKRVTEQTYRHRWNQLVRGYVVIYDTAGGIVGSSFWTCSEVIAGSVRFLVLGLVVKRPIKRYESEMK